MKFHNNKFVSYNGSKCPVCNQAQFIDTKIYREAEKRCLNCTCLTSNNLWNRKSEIKDSKLGNTIFAVVKYDFEWDEKQIPKTDKLFYKITDAQKYRKSILRNHWMNLLEKGKFDDSFEYWKPKIEKYIGPITNTKESVDDLIFVLDNNVFFNEFTQIYFKLKENFNMIQIHAIEDKGSENTNSRCLIYEEHLTGLESYYNGNNKNGRPLLSINKDNKSVERIKEINLKLFKNYVLNKSITNEWCISNYLSGDRDDKWSKYQSNPTNIENKLKENEIFLDKMLEKKEIEKIKEIIEEEMQLKFVNFCNSIDILID